MNKKHYLLLAKLGLMAVVVAVFLFPYLQRTSPVKLVNKKVISSSSPGASVDLKKARDEYFFRMLKDPATGQLPPNYRTRELDFAKNLNAKLGKSKSFNAVTWKEAGPTDVGGRTRALAVDVNNNYILAGGVSGGIWKSTDNGNTWTMKSTTSDFLSVTSIAQDTRSGQTATWYYSTGEWQGNSSSASGAPFRGTGIYKSTDNGDTWTKIQDVPPHPFSSNFNYVSRIVVSPTTGSVFIASNAIGIYRSKNGGTSFSLIKGAVNQHIWSDVVVASNGTVIAYLSKSSFVTQTDTPGIFKSTDDGDTWTNITPSTYPTTTYTRAYLASAPSNADILYVLTDNGVKSNNRDVVSFHKIFVSTGTALNRSSNIPDFSSEGLQHSSQGVFDVQGGYNMMVAVSPEDPNLVIIGGTNLFRSFDGFATKPTNRKNTWIAGYHPTQFLYPKHHPDQHSFAFDPVNPKIFWSGHDGGLSYTSDITNTNYSDVFPWTDKNNGYNVTQFYTVAIYDSAGDKRIIGGSQDNGSPFFTFDGTTTSPSSDVSSGDGAYNWFTRNFTLTGSQNGRVNRLRYTGPNRTPDWNNNWSVITPSGASGQLFINPNVPDPNDENYLYYLSGSQLWRNNSVSTIPDFQNGTTSGWTQLTNNTAPANYIYSAIAISKTNSSDVLYFGASSTNNGPPKLYKLNNAKTSISAATDISSTLFAAGAQKGYIASIAVNPDNSDEILVVISNYAVPSIFYSSDGGGKFFNVEGNLADNGVGGAIGPSVRSAGILPTSSGAVYFVGTSTGLYSTTTLKGAATTWTQEGGSVIGNVIVNFISLRKVDKYVAVGTHGRGIFTAFYTPATAINDENQLPTDYTLSQNYPNPFNPSTNINFSLPLTGKVVITLFDALGRKVKDIVNKEFSAGNHSVNFDAANLSSGVYFYRLQADKFVQTKKMILLR